jgi:hypothetical protein
MVKRMTTVRLEDDFVAWMRTSGRRLKVTEGYRKLHADEAAGLAINTGVR